MAAIRVMPPVCRFLWETITDETTENRYDREPRSFHIMFATMLMYVGGMLIIGGCIAAYRHRERALRAIRVLHLSPTHATNLPRSTEDQIRVDGIIAGDSEDTLIAPCSGSPAVWFRVRLHERVASGSTGMRAGGSLWATFVDEWDSRTFYVEDESHHRIRVDARKMSVSVESRVFQAVTEEARQRLQALLASRGITRFKADLYEEECLRPGANVIAVGLLSQEPSAPTPYSYRDVPSRSLVMHAHGDGQVIVGTVARLKQESRGGYLIGRISIAIGATTIAIGLVLHFLLPE